MYDVHTLCTNFYRRKSGLTIKPKAPLMMMMAYNVIEKKTHQKTSLILFFYSLLSVNGIGLFFFSSSFKSCSVFLVIQFFFERGSKKKFVFTFNILVIWWDFVHVKGSSASFKFNKDWLDEWFFFLIGCVVALMAKRKSFYMVGLPFCASWYVYIQFLVLWMRKKMSKIICVRTF